jgi:hypothetical protein
MAADVRRWTNDPVNPSSKSALSRVENAKDAR